MNYDVIIVGAGFTGIYALHKAREAGLTAIVIEAGDGVGGTWYWNRYPGARCDVESREYQYGFSDELQKGWRWSERYATQPEIRAYLQYVVDTLRLSDGMRLGCLVEAATFMEEAAGWRVTIQGGETLTGRYLILGTGPLSASRIPDIAGLGQFSGDHYHTADWPRAGVNFKGKRVGVIGTGSSGIQVIPLIANDADQVFVFQRTPSYTMPAFNRPLTDDEVDLTKKTMIEDRQRARANGGGPLIPVNMKGVFDVDEKERIRELDGRWGHGGFAMVGSFIDVLRSRKSNDFVSDYVRNRMKGVVKDPETARRLIPTDYPFLAKRPCLNSGYLEAFNEDHVELVDIRQHPIEKITSDGIKVDGKIYDLDILVFATGFDAMTGAVTRIDITGRNGVHIRDKWAAGPRTYLGLGSEGFPNLFIVVGPGSPSVLTNVVVSIEQQVDWIIRCLVDLGARKAATIEPTLAAENAWVAHVNEMAAQTLYLTTASWYLGANVPGKPRVFMPYVGGVAMYNRELEKVAAEGYEGFTIT